MQGVDFLLRRPETELQSYIGVGGSHAVPHRIDRSRVVCRCCSCNLRRIRGCHRLITLVVVDTSSVATSLLTLRLSTHQVHRELHGKLEVAVFILIFFVLTVQVFFFPAWIITTKNKILSLTCYRRLSCMSKQCLAQEIEL